MTVLMNRRAIEPQKRIPYLKQAFLTENTIEKKQPS